MSARLERAWSAPGARAERERFALAVADIEEAIDGPPLAWVPAVAIRVALGLAQVG
jgi:hypothetical protein